MSNERASPCFTPGTGIATNRGMIAVERLQRGDRVLTADNGLCPIAWIGRRTLRLAEIRDAEDLRPIMIRAGALGEGRPARTMIVSPKHRFLVEYLSPTGSREKVLRSAEKLVDHKGILPVPVLGVTYIHLMFERHQVILANGAWTESFLPDASNWQKIGAAQRLEIEDLFPSMKNGGFARYSDPARPLDDRPLWKRRMPDRTPLRR